MTNILVAYFSHKGNNYVSGEIVELTVGNTEIVAEKIKKMTGADIFEIKPDKTYPKDYYETTKVAKAELQNGERPELTEYLDDISSYETIILGYPNWWGTMPTAVMTFLEKYDFSDKTLLPFCTNEGSGMGRSEDDLSQLCPNSKIAKGLSVKGSAANSCDEEVKNWLKSNGIELSED